MSDEDMKNQHKVHGPMHAWAAFTYSLSGIKRLWQETAFRHGTALVVAVIILFALVGVHYWAYFGIVIVYFIYGATEALNTAIEEIVDRVSPEISSMGKYAKDLGSLAVMLVLLSGGVWVIFSIWATFSG